MGSDFPTSFVQNLHRIIQALRPSGKNEWDSSNKRLESAEKFMGLALTDGQSRIPSIQEIIEEEKRQKASRTLRLDDRPTRYSDYHRKEDQSCNGRKRKKRLTSPERWEIKQLIASGAVKASDYPDLEEADLLACLAFASNLVKSKEFIYQKYQSA